MTAWRLDNSKWVTTGVARPHIVGEHEADCWCQPNTVEADCDCHRGQVVYGHGEVELLPDVQDRMMAYSLTWPGLAPQSAV